MGSLVRPGYTTWRDRREDIERTSTTTSEMLTEALSQDLAEIEQRRTPFMKWAMRVPEPKSGSLNFERFPFQEEWYREGAEDKEMVVKKATQIGCTAWLTRWALYWADTKGLTVLYIFPTRTDVFDFSDARVKPMIEGSDYLRERVVPGYVQNKGLKAIGLGFVYTRGSESKRGLDSIDADVLAFDEYDTLVAGNIPDAERRVSGLPSTPGAPKGLIRRIGVPSISDFGITKEYAKSDQRRWFVKCDGCGEWQYLTYKDNVDEERVERVCRKANCRRPLNVLKGEWVPKFPDRSMRGYHAPRLIVAETDLQKIVEAHHEREPYKQEVHFTKDLALEWEGEGGRLTRNEVLAARRNDIFQQEGYRGDNVITMGIDVASTRALNVVISEHISERVKRSLWLGEVDSFDELDEKMARYNVNMACIDHLPEGRLARAFEERHPGRVYLVNYATIKVGDPVQVDDEQKRIAVKRVEVIDATIARVREQRHLLPMDLPEDFVGHMCSTVRRIERDEEDKVTVSYQATGPDDYLQACVYDTVALEGWWIRQQAADAEREVEQPLDEMLPFERSSLGDNFEQGDYSAGPGEGDYTIDEVVERDPWEE